MPIRVITATTSAIAIAATLTISAQTPTPQTQPQSQPQTQPQTQQTQPQVDRQRPATDTQASATAADRVLTLTGCLQAEKDVPGRRESVTERAGVGEDYILTNVKMAQGTSTSGMGLGSMYQIKGGSVDNDEVKKHLGHQVEVVGSIEAYSDIRGGTSGRDSNSATGTPRATTSAGNSNLPNFKATSLKMIAATCPAQ